MAITEARKTKVIGETVMYDLAPCRGSAVKHFSFYKVSRKISKNDLLNMIFESLVTNGL